MGLVLYCGNTRLEASKLVEKRILIIEDETNIATLIEMYLEREGYAVMIAGNGEAGLASIAKTPADLVILDIMLPGIDGFEVCRRMRAKSSNIPVIMLTARDTYIDKVVGLEMGADDYVTKPFNARELVARVRAVLRRTETMQESTKTILGSVTIDLGGRRVFKDDQEIHLTMKEFELLSFLAAHHGQALSRVQILEQVWGYDFLGDTRTVDVHVRQVRRKLGDDCPLKTVWGYGYKCEE